MSQGAAQTEDLRRRLEAAKTELERLLDGCRGQRDVEMLTEERCTSPATNGAEGGPAKSQHSERRSQRGKRNLLMPFKINTSATPANSDEFDKQMSDVCRFRCPTSFNPVMYCTCLLFFSNFLTFLSTELFKCFLNISSCDC